MTGPNIQLRPWMDSDFEPFAEMNADEEVMRFFLKRLTSAESRQFMERQQASIEERGWGLWAVEVDGDFAGFTGLWEPAFETDFTPCVEIGWRFRQEFWGRSIAYSAARMAEEYAFETLGLEELVSMTAVGNERSRRLMERLGFTRDQGDDFLHPSVPQGHWLEAHVLYRKKST